MSINKMPQYITGLLLAIALTGCSTVQVGKDFDIYAFEGKAIAGETTKSQVHNWLGAPKSTGISLNEKGERLEEWLYFYGKGQLPTMKDTDLKILQIRFDKDGIVRSYNWSGGK